MRNASIDGLRAVCIGLVLLAHLSGTRNFLHSDLLELYGNLGVRVFLVLSGYLITAQLLKEHERTGSISLPAFYIRRAYRIFPAAYLFMVVTIVVYWNALTRSNILAALTYTINYHHGNWVLGHLWTLSVQEQFYLLWPLTLLVFYRHRLQVVVAVIAVGPLVRVLFWSRWGHRGLEHPFPVFMDALAMGCALAMIEPRLKRYQQILSSPRFLLVPIVTALLPITQLWSTRFYKSVGLSFLHLGIALSLKHVLGKSYAILQLRPLAWLGTISYSLYLWQQLFLNRTLSAPWTAFPLNLILALGCGAASYYLVEQPFLEMRQRRRRPSMSRVLHGTPPRAAMAKDSKAS